MRDEHFYVFIPRFVQEESKIYHLEVNVSDTLATIVGNRSSELKGKYLTCSYGNTPGDMTEYSSVIMDIAVSGDVVAVVTLDAFEHPVLRLFSGNVEPLEAIYEYGDLWFRPTSDELEWWCIYKTPLRQAFLSFG